MQFLLRCLKYGIEREGHSPQERHHRGEEKGAPLLLPPLILARMKLVAAHELRIDVAEGRDRETEERRGPHGGRCPGTRCYIIKQILAYFNFK